MDDIERALADDAIAPSSGFGIGVMDAVRRAAAEPPPIPFPWGRLVAGLCACGALAWAGTILAVQAGPNLLPAETLSYLAGATPGLGYAALAMLLSLAAARLPRFFASSDEW
jgi:hypothetical protein